MAKNYEVWERYYLPVIVKSICPGYKYPIELGFIDSNLCDTDDTTSIADEPDVLLTADEIATVINTERDDTLAELKARNAELEALLKEVMATRDEAVKQNNELIADRNNWKEAAQRYHDNATVADAAADALQKENKELKAKVAENANTISRLSANKVALTEEVGRLRETIADRTKDVHHYNEENDKLKTERDDLASQVGKNLAEIQDLNAEIHFLKAKRDKQKAAYDELKCRYDELDSVNHEQAEKIRKLDKALTDLKQRNDKLQDENTNLTFQLEDQPEEEPTKTVHVVTNDGTDIAFNRNAEIMYRTDVDMFVVNDGDKTVAGFLRGDKPGNLAYWWTE